MPCSSDVKKQLYRRLGVDSSRRFYTEDLNNLVPRIDTHPRDLLGHQANNFATREFVRLLQRLQS